MEFDNLKLSSSHQGKSNKEQIIDHNKDNVNKRNVDGKSEISAITNCFTNNFKNINNSAMKNKDNMEKIVCINVDSAINK